MTLDKKFSNHPVAVYFISIPQEWRFVETSALCQNVYIYKTKNYFVYFLLQNLLLKNVEIQKKSNHGALGWL